LRESGGSQQPNQPVVGDFKEHCEYDPQYVTDRRAGYCKKELEEIEVDFMG